MKQALHLMLAVFLSIASASGWTENGAQTSAKKPSKQTVVVQAKKADPETSAPLSSTREPTVQARAAEPQSQIPAAPNTLQILNQMAAGANGIFTSMLPSEANGWSIFPIVKVLYPTGEKPLVVVAFKCPTEAVFNVSTPPIKVFHFVVSTGMDTINMTDILPFKLEQLCS